jgi:hypothetical protein
MITDDCTDGRHGIILKQHFARFHQTVFLEKLDNGWNRRMNRTALLTAGLFAVEAAICLSNDM